MKKIQSILLILLFTTINIYGQACGGGVISFKIFTETNQKKFDYQLYYISKEKIDSISKVKTKNEDWTNKQNLGHGIIIDSEFADLIAKETTKNGKYSNPTVENRIVKVITPELSTSLALIRLVNNDRKISIITYGGNCAEGQNVLIWDENPKTVPIDRRVNLQELELENFPFTVNGLEFTINDINCKWQYLVQPLADSNGNLKIIHQNLISIQQNKSLFSTNNSVDNNNQHYSKPKLSDLENRDYFNLECTDINKDTYCDFQIVTERAAAGANTSYNTYLFNPERKRFEYSEIFSGANIEYDSVKNRISSMWKMSVFEYSFSFKNLKPNKRELEFLEYVKVYRDSTIYKKLVDEKVVNRKKIVLKDEDVDYWNVENLLERNQKR